MGSMGENEAYSAGITHSNEILITGAGPTGLLLSYELLRRGIPIRLIEKRKGPSHTSRGITIQARSMEMFDHMGIAHRLKEVCLECPGNIYRFPGMTEEECPKTNYNKVMRGDKGEAALTRFPFYYKINQNDFERVLREHLLMTHGLVPEFRTELVGIDRSEEQGKDESQKRVAATIRLPSGEMQTITYPWVVGCDGVRSFVRNAAEIPFPGKIIAAMAMMDVALKDVNFNDRWMNYYFNRDMFMLVTRMPGDRLWRIFWADPKGEFVYMEDKKKAVQDMAEIIGVDFKIAADPEWASAWECGNNIAERYHDGRLIICGDASHVHSPSGGAGMNGCMQDAFNLGWKLAAIWKGQAKPDILNTYEAERRPIGKQISDGAMETHKITMGFGIELDQRLPMTKVEGWEERTVKLISGFSHNYCNVVTLPSAIANAPVSGPKAGQRAPDALLTRSPLRYLYHFTCRPIFTLLVAPSLKKKKEQLPVAVKIRDSVCARFPGQVSVFLISDQREEEFDFDHQSVDELGQFAERYGIDANAEEGRLVLVRPDLYIGMACNLSDWEAVLEYMGSWYIPHEETKVPASHFNV